MTGKLKIFRLLPMLIVTAVFLLFVKISSMISGTDALFVSDVQAVEAEKPSNVSTEKPSDLPDQGATEKKTEDKKTDEAKPEEKKSEDGKHSAEKKSEKKDGDNPNVSKTIEVLAEQRYTAVEVELLQSLSKRREELNRWENNIQIKEAALEATEKRIADKISQIEAMKKQVAELLAQYNNQEDAKIRSLVKIYENMKPGEAARIFDEVEMPILLLVIDTMTEKKAAPILAAMNPKKAKQVTVELANERRINNKVSGDLQALDAAPQAEDASAQATPAKPAEAPKPAASPAATPTEKKPE